MFFRQPITVGTPPQLAEGCSQALPLLHPCQPWGRCLEQLRAHLYSPLPTLHGVLGLLEVLGSIDKAWTRDSDIEGLGQAGRACEFWGQ